MEVLIGHIDFRSRGGRSEEEPFLSLPDSFLILEISEDGTGKPKSSCSVIS